MKCCATRCRNRWLNSRACPNQTKWLFALAVLITVVVVVPLTLLNLHSIWQAAEWCTALGQGHYGWGSVCQSIRTEGRDKVEPAARPGRNAARPGNPGGAGARHPGNIATTSQEIATGNQDLSHRIEQTASNAQATVSSVGNHRHGAANGIVFANGQPAGGETASTTATRGGSVVGSRRCPACMRSRPPPQDPATSWP